MCSSELIRRTERSTDNTGMKGLLSLIHWLDAACNEGHLRQPDKAAGDTQGRGTIQRSSCRRALESVSEAKTLKYPCLSCLSQVQS